MLIDCFDKHGVPGLKEKFNSLTDKGMSEKDQREIGKQLAIEYHKGLHEELNTLRKKVGKPAVEYKGQPDTSEKLKSISEDYDNKISEIKSTIKDHTPKPEPKHNSGIAFAPFREKNVGTLEEDQQIRNSEDYKLHQQTIADVAKGLGVKVVSKIDTWGGYVDSETGRPVQEVSNVIHIEATPDEAKLMAAVLGKAAPEMQDSVLVGNYREDGSGLEHTIKTGSFENAEKSLPLLKENGIEYFTVDKNSGDIIILDTDNSNSQNIINFVDKLQENGIETEHIYQPTEASFIGREDYDGIIKEQGSEIGDKNGFNIDAFIKETKDKYDSLKDSSGEPPKPPKKEPVDFDKAGNDYTAITKARQSEIEAARKVFEKESNTTWTEIHDRAIEDLQTRYPSKTLYEAARDQVTEQASYYDAGLDYNPTSKDIAIIEYLAAETEKRVNDLDIESDDFATTAGAMAQYDSLATDLTNIAKASQTREAGTAFGMRNREVKIDYKSDAGLKARRIEFMRAKGGEKLTPEENEMTAEQWERDKEVMRKEYELKLKSQKETFEKEISRLKKEAGKPNSPASKRERTLKQSGKDWADKIRQLKSDKGSLQADVTLGLRDLAVEAVAQLVEKGAAIVDAIKEVLKDVKYNSIKEDELTNHIVSGITRMDNRNLSIEEIKTFANDNKVDDVTSEMVSKGFIKKYVDSFIGEAEPEDIIKTAASELKSVLPEITEDRLREAYIKQGEFSQPTKKQLETSFKKDQALLSKLSKIEQNIADLKANGDILLEKGNTAGAKKISDKIEEAQKELQKELNRQGKKFSRADKYTKASYDSRSQSHNNRIDELSDKILHKLNDTSLSHEQRIALNVLNDDLLKAKISLNPESKLDQSRVVDNGAIETQKAKSKFDKIANKLDNISVIGKFKNEIQKVIDQFASDKNKSEQDIKLQRTKNQLRSRTNEQQRKINAGEFEDKPITTLNQSDRELIQLQVQKNKIDSDFIKKQREVADKNKSKIQKFLETLRIAYVAGLIYKFGTFAKVAVAGLVRPTFEVITKQTGGRVFNKFFKDISKAAKAGGESTSLLSTAKSYEAQFSQHGEKRMKEISERDEEKYQQSLSKYQDQVTKALDIKNEKGEDSKEFKAAQKDLQKSKNEVDKDLLKSTSNILFEFIGSSSIVDALNAFAYRSNKIERMFGYFDTENWKGKNIQESAKNWRENLNYVLGTVGRSHSAMKTFSARANFAAGFVARLESAVENGEDIRENILQIAQDSYLDWDRGKYQQSNYITDQMNKLAQSLENSYKGQKWEKYAKASAAFLKLDLPITRVPVNILHEAVAEYTVGFFRAAIDINKEYRKARKEVAINEGLTPSDPEFKQALKERMQGMDAKTAAMISRSFRKGSFGLGLYGVVAALGIMNFGGFHHKGEVKKKQEEMEPGELNAGEIMLGKTKLGDIVSKIIEHTPAFFPALFAQNFLKVKKEEVKSGKTTWEAVYDGFMSNMEYLQDAIPQTKVINPIGITTNAKDAAVRQLAPPYATEDVDENGNMIKRKAMNFSDQINLAIGKRGEVLSESNYKQVLSINSSYKKIIKDMYRNNASQSEIDDVIKQRDESIKQIRDLNKEEYELLHPKNK